MTEARPLRTLLVANRGEVSRRVQRTAASMGLRTVAVFAEPDAGEPFVREADVAVPLRGATAAQTYLHVPSLLAAAAATAADAVHPGYGFLAEDAGFAAACAAVGLVFVGPSVDAIRAMGSKIEAKARMRAAGVPVLPDALLGPRDDARDQAGGLGYPVLVKAAAGGGGIGMRVVRDAAALTDAIRGARRDAAAAFGDETVYLERYLDRARHVEVQVLGDTHGSLVHCFERECSIQRRHQKVVEEAPSPAVDGELRARLGDAALRAAAAIGYTSAGTVEFLLGADGAFFFIEMNTRLQVEHPVTEMVTGLDLVRLQLEVAAGRPLSFTQSELRLAGHAIEARLYAEDPARGYLPSSGRIHRFATGPTPGVRYDAGIETGSAVSPAFDGLLAKVVVHATTRDEAAARLARAIDELQVHGVSTNRELLVAVLRDEEFLDGGTDTGYLERRPELLHPDDDGRRRVHVIAAAIADSVRERRTSPVLSTILPGWRNLRAGPAVTTYEDGATGSAVRVATTPRPDGRLTMEVDGRDHAVRVVAVAGEQVTVEIDGLRHTLTVHAVGPARSVNSSAGQTDLVRADPLGGHRDAALERGCVAPVTGRVIAVPVAAGETVAAGQVLVVIEAMKMEHRVQAARAGVVESVLVAPGDGVERGTVVAVLEAS